MNYLWKQYKAVDNYEIRVDEKFPHKNSVHNDDQIYLHLITKYQVFELSSSKFSVSLELESPNQHQNSIIPERK